MWCRDILLQEKLEHPAEVQEFAGTVFMWQAFKWQFDVCSLLWTIIRLSKGLSHVMATSLDTLNSSTKLPSIWVFLRVCLTPGCTRSQCVTCAQLCVSAHGYLITLIYTILRACPWSFILLKMWKPSDSAGCFHSVCKPTKQFLSVLW